MNIDVYILHISIIKDNFRFVSSFVSKERRIKAERYVNEKDRLLSYGAGYLIQKYLPKKETKETENKKPYFEGGPYFNVSHSGEYVVLAVHNCVDVGIDIERINENKIDAIKFTLCDEEKMINDINDLFGMWTNKESLIKCMSSNLNDIRKMRGLPLEGYRNINNNDYYTKSMIYDGYSLSVTLNTKQDFNIKLHQVNSLED